MSLADRANLLAKRAKRSTDWGDARVRGQDRRHPHLIEGRLLFWQPSSAEKVQWTYSAPAATLANRNDFYSNNNEGSVRVRVEDGSFTAVTDVTTDVSLYSVFVSVLLNPQRRRHVRPPVGQSGGRWGHGADAQEGELDAGERGRLSPGGRRTAFDEAAGHA